MHTTPRQRVTPPARRPPSLLGTYPVPELHLVGAPIPGNRRSPIQWQPTPPPQIVPQHRSSLAPITTTPIPGRRAAPARGRC